MGSSFEFIGKLKKFKEDSKMIGYEDAKPSKNGEWLSRRINFMAQAGYSTTTLTINGSKKKDESNSIYTFSAGTKDEKGSKLEIPFKDRFKQENIDKVANFKKLVLDLRPYEFKTHVRDMKKKIEDGDEFSEEELKVLGATTQAEGVAKYEEIQKMHHEYISEWDFAEAVNNLLNDEEYADAKFYIRGNVDYSYGEKKGQFYDNFTPLRISLADPEGEESMVQSLDFIYGGECINHNEAEQRVYVTGYHFEYVNNLKKNTPIKVVIALPTNSASEKKIENFKSKFTGEDEDKFYSRAIMLDVINGSPVVKITHEQLMEMITDDERSDYEDGWLNEKDLMEKYAGGNVRGAFVHELWFKKFGKGGSVAEATAYTEDDLVFKAKAEAEEEDPFADEEI